MATTPTPEQAQNALRDFEQQRQESAAASGYPVAYWIVGGVVVAALGVFYDLRPGFASSWGPIITMALLALSVLSNTRWGGRLFGRRVRVRQQPAGRRMVAGLIGAAVALVVVVAAAHVTVPHLSAILGIFFGLLLAVAGPWWQRRVLARAAVRP